jgi:hypothetical protein
MQKETDYCHISSVFGTIVGTIVNKSGKNAREDQRVKVKKGKVSALFSVATTPEIE